MKEFLVKESPFKGIGDRYFYVYQTTNKLNGFIYIGCRIYKGDDPNEDSYLGCGVSSIKGEPKFRFENKNSPFVDAVREFGVGNFEKHILLYCGSKRMALQIERMIVDEIFTKRTDTYNKTIGRGSPPTGSGSKNNNAGNLWSEERKKEASEKRKLSEKSVGSNNGKATACVLYDFLEDKSFNLSYVREANKVVGEKLDINWVGVMKFRYFLHLPNEDPYIKANSLKKPSKTLAIIDCIKRGLDRKQTTNELKSKGISGAIINRTYQNLDK